MGLIDRPGGIEQIKKPPWEKAPLAVLKVRKYERERNEFPQRKV